MPFAPIPVSTQDLVDFLSEKFGLDVTTPDLLVAADKFNMSYATVKKRLKQYKTGIGKWNLTIAEKLEKNFQNKTANKTTLVDSFDPAYLAAKDLVPDKDPNYVPFGNFTDLKKIIKSKVFYPTFITGLSGNGKTFGVEQACAQLGRDLIRVNITVETDEDDLIGGFRLVDGNTVWHNGPVLEALQRGAVLLLDELDLASNKILCLQSILEGNGVFIKKIGKQVYPEKGFTVVATANTKGKGSDDGRFVGTNVLNEAFLERFPLTFEQEYPSIKIEQKLLHNYCSELNCCDDEYIENLGTWAEIIRKTFKEGGVDEVISTRRLVHIIRAFAIFKDRLKAIKLCLNRFDDETKAAFLELYSKIDAKVDLGETPLEVDAD
jgi:MoxR-like ATPase|tara:strand:+ start:72 stop:1205 length:1134 start_codon:yes stop_codon:yes gene_type:complete